MRRRVTVLVSVSICLLAAGCGGGNDQVAAESTTTSPTTTMVRPLAEGAVDDLLLTAEQINAIMEAGAMTVTRNRNAMSDDADTMEPRECLAIDGAAQEQVYAGSGFTAVRDLTFAESDDFKHYAQEAVVLFSGGKQAKAFFEKSVQQWPQCREYTHVQSGTEWIPGPITNDNDMLSVVTTQQNGPADGWACGRALAVRNNIVVDVNTCSAAPKDSAAQVATQVADKIRVH